MNNRREIPEQVPASKVIEILTQSLHKKSDELIDKIHEFLKEELEENVSSAEFVIFPEEYGYSANSIWMYLDGKDKRLGKDDPSLFAGKSFDFYSSFEQIPLIAESTYEEINYPHLITDIIHNWFKECWWKAGGWYYNVPVTIIGHDGWGHLEHSELTKKSNH